MMKKTSFKVCVLDQIQKGTVQIQNSCFGIDVINLLNQQQNHQLENIGKNICEQFSQICQSNSKSILNLKEIFLWGNNIGNNGCKLLSKGGWNHLTSLGLSKNKIGNEGVSHLTKAKWSELKYIGLAFNNITGASIVHLSRATWKKIQRIQISENQGFGWEIKYFLLFQTNCLSIISLSSTKNSQTYSQSFVDCFKQQLRSKSEVLTQVRF